jgi:hypothetical protein
MTVFSVVLIPVVIWSVTAGMRFHSESMAFAQKRSFHVHEKGSSPVEKCLHEAEGEAETEEFIRGQFSGSDDDVCSGLTYDRKCLESAIPIHVSYPRIKACFRCCVFFWTEQLNLTENLRYWEEAKVLHLDNGATPWKHNRTEVFLTQNSVMKFADVVFTADLYHWPPRDVIRENSVVDVGGHFELDPKHGQRPCVHKQGGRCDVRDGGVIFLRKFDELSKLFNNNDSSWARLGKNVSILICGDHAIWPRGGGGFAHAEKTGLRIFQHNPFNQPRSLPTVESSRHENDRGMFPLGMFGVDPIMHDDVLTRFRRPPVEKTRLLFCGGITVKTDYRAEVLRIVKDSFNCVGHEARGKDEYLGNISISKFALSPAGHGLNCFRTWEILAVGSIPIIEYHPSNENLYSGMPVLQVKDWRNVTPDFLAQEWSRIMAEPSSVSHAKAFLPYWLSTIYGHAAELT